MADTTERIVLEVDDAKALIAARRTNAELEKIEKKAGLAVGSLGRVVDGVSSGIGTTTQRSLTSIERQVQAVEKRVQSIGQTAVQRLEAEQAATLRRVGGDPRAVERITAGYAKLIEEQKRVEASANSMGDRLKQALENPRGAISGLATSLTGLWGIVAAGVGAVAGLGIGIFHVVESMTDWQDQLNNVSAATGLTRKEVQLFEAAATASGVSTDIWWTIMRGLSRTMEDTTAEARLARKALADIGVSVYEAGGKIRPTAEILQSLSDAMANRAPTERMQILMDVLGRAGSQALPLFNGKLRETIDEFRRMGIGLDEGVLAPIDRMDERLDKAAARWEDWKRRAKTSIVEVVDALAGLLPQGGGGGAETRIIGGRPVLVPAASTTGQSSVVNKTRERIAREDLAAGAAAISGFRTQRELGVTGLQRRMADLTEQQRRAEARLEGTGLGEAAARAAIAEVERLDAEIASVQARIKAIQEAPAKAAEAARQQAEVIAKVEKDRLLLIESAEKRSLEAAAKEAEAMIEAQNRVAQATAQYQADTAAMQDRMREQSLAAEAAALERSRDQQIRQASALGVRTVEDKIALEQKKLEIEIEYLKRSGELHLQKLQRDTANAVSEAMRTAQSQEDLDRRLELVRQESAQREKITAAETTAGIAAAQQETANRTTQLAIDANQRLFDRLQHSAEGLLDQLLTSGKSFGRRIADAFMLPVLTAFKQLASASIASLLMPVFGGQGGGLRLPGLGAIGAMGTMPGIGHPGAPGGTPGFAGPVQGLNLPGLGIGGATGFGGLTAAGVGPLAIGGAGLGLMGAYKLGQRGGVGGALAPALGVASGLLGFGGLVSMFPSLLAAGPWGWVAAAGIGAFVGIMGLLRKSAEEKVREKIQQVYGVTIREKTILSQIVAIAKETYGGNLDAAIRSQPVKDIVELYALTTTGRSLGLSNRPTPISLYQSGGSVYAAPSVYATTGVAPSAQSVTVVMPVQVVGAKEFLTGETVNVISRSGRAVQQSALGAQRANVGRRQGASLQLAPNLLTS